VDDLSLDELLMNVQRERSPILSMTSLSGHSSAARQERGHRQDRWFLVRPLPGGSIRPVCAVLVGIISARYLFVKEFLFCVGTDSLKLRNAFNNIHGQAEPINVVLDGQLQRSVDIALFLVTADVHIAVIRAAVSQTMDEPRISVEIKDDGFVDGEKRIKILVTQPVRMFRARLQFKKVDYVDVTNLEIGKFFAQHRNGCQGFLRRYVTG